MIAREPGRGLRAGAAAAGASRGAGPRRNAAWARDWDAPRAQPHALTLILDALRALDRGRDTPPAPSAVVPQVAARLAVAEQVRTPDGTAAAQGPPTRRQGVAAARRISVEDAERRHGRKSRRLRVDGDTRHGRRDLDSRLRVAVGVTPANAPEARVTDTLEADVAAQPGTLRAWPIDRAYWASQLVQPRTATWAIGCKAWPVRQGPSFPTRACPLAWERQAWQGPGGERMPLAPGEVVPCPAAPWGGGLLRTRCTTSASGRSVRLHPDAAWLQALRARQQPPQGRAPWRERVAVAHALAHLGRWQGRRARSRGVRQNVCALRRCAVVHHLHGLMSLPQTEWQAA